MTRPRPSAAPTPASAGSGRRIPGSEPPRPRTDDAHAEEGRQSGPAAEERRHRVLSQGVAAVVGSIAEAAVIKDGDVFFLCDRDGSVPLHGDHGLGLYYHDCRYLSGYELRLAGASARPLAATAAAGDQAVIELTNPDIRTADGTLIAKEHIGITWTREVAGEDLALLDEIAMRRYGGEPVELPLELRFDARFEDIYAIRGLWTEHLGRIDGPHWTDDALRWVYHGADDVTRIVSLSFEPTPAERGDRSARWHLPIATGHETVLRVATTVTEVPQGAGSGAGHGGGDGETRHALATQPVQPRDVAYRVKPVGDHRSGWLRDACEVITDSSRIDRLLDRSFRDLRLLRTSLDEASYFAAGVPWFVTLFGRDAIITALQVLAFDPTIAAATLALLAAYQGKRDDPWKAEEPGKILHELRIGEYAGVGAIPHTPYYGTVDATPLFVLLVAEHARWTGSLELFRELRDHVDAALAWTDRALAGSATGWIEYRSGSEGGLINQAWKDSGDAIVNADGSLAEPPVAVVEVQGYAFHAKIAVAELYDRDGDGDRAAQLREEAAALRERFERDFWLEEDGFYALALQRGRRPCAVRSSDPGHLLWSGIASEERASATARMLLGEDMFGGWGVRTLSDREQRYNPIGYHLGTVWPHDNAIIAAGLRRYGHDAEAMRIARAIVDAAGHFRDARLPEAFAGYRRDAYGVPVRYPVACHPQAWAAGTAPMLIATLAGLQPDGFERRLRIVRPLMPPYGERLGLCDIRVAGGAARLRFERQGHSDRARVEVEHIDGDLEVTVEDADG